MGLWNFLRKELSPQSKALMASPEVLEAAANRTFTTFPLIAVPNRGDQMRAAFERMVDANYGYLYAHQPAVRAVVDYLASNVAQLALRVYERTSDIERHEASDHPAAETMRNPNQQTPGQKLIFNLVRDFFVYGNAFCLKWRISPGAPLMLTQLPPHRTSVIGPSYFSVDAYRLYRTDGTHRDEPPENVFHWVGSTNPDDPRLGLSPLETLRQELAGDSAVKAALDELVKAGLLSPGYISRPLDAPEWSEPAAKAFQEAWANALKDQGRHTPVLEEGMSFEDFGVSPKDAQILAGREFTRDEVARQFGMVHCPPESDEERSQFLADVLPPLCEMFSAHLDLSILKGEFSEDKFYFEFDLDEKLTGDERLKALVSAAGGPVLLRNEARAMLNKPPVPDGDTIITPLNVTVGGKPSPAVMPVQSPIGPPQDGSHRTDGVSSLDIGMTKGILEAGERFGKWTVLGYAGPNKHRQRSYECECDCGERRVVVGQDLKNGHSKSCSKGCSSRRDEVSYTWMHGRLREQRGAARDLKCVDCDQRAATWSFAKDRAPQDHWRWDERDRPYSNDPQDYDPRCIACHNTFDKTFSPNGNGHGKALLLARREGQRQRRERYAKEFTVELRKFFTDQERSTRSKSTKDFDLDHWTQKLKAILLKLMRSVVEREGGIAAAHMALADFDMAQVENYLAKVAEGEATDTNLAINDALQVESPGDVFVQAKEVRAQGLGGTLATKMSAFATTEAAKQTPDASHRMKTWVVADTDTSAHPEMDGERVPLTEPFSNGKQYPPYEHPKCECLVDVR